MHPNDLGEESPSSQLGRETQGVPIGKISDPGPIQNSVHFGLADGGEGGEGDGDGEGGLKCMITR